MAPALATLRRPRRVERTDTSLVETTEIAAWDEFYRARGGKDIDRRRRRLLELGTLCVEHEERGGRAVERAAWVLDEKRAWLRRTGERAAWLEDPSYRGFVLGMVARDDGPVVVSTLTVDGKPIAGTIDLHDRDGLRGLVTAYDERYRKYGPGMLLTAERLRYAKERRLRFDMGIGDFDYKGEWRTGVVTLSSYAIATRPAGLAALAAGLLRVARERAQHRSSARARRPDAQPLRV